MEYAQMESTLKRVIVQRKRTFSFTRREPIKIKQTGYEK